MRKFPITPVKEIAKKYGLSQVIMIARDDKKNLVHFVTYGSNRKNCEMAATDGRKIKAVYDAQPHSLEGALLVAKKTL